MTGSEKKIESADMGDKTNFLRPGHIQLYYMRSRDPLNSHPPHPIPHVGTRLIQSTTSKKLSKMVGNLAATVQLTGNVAGTCTTRDART